MPDRFAHALLTTLALLGLSALAFGQAAAPTVSAADYPSIDAAIGALPPEGGTVLIPPGRHVIKQTINLSFARHKNPQFSVNLRGASKLATVLWLDTEGEPGIDFTGNSYWSVSDLHIQNHSANVGVLLARTPPGANGCNGEFRNVYFSGCFPVAAVYMTGAEGCRFDNCAITNQLKKWYNSDVEWMTEGEAGVMISPNNIRDIQSPYCETTGGGSNTEFSFHGCTISTEAKRTCGIMVYGQTCDVRMTSCYLHCDGIAAVYLDGTKGNVGPVSLRDLRIEGEHGRHALYACGHVFNVLVDGGSWNSTREVILQESMPSFTDQAAANNPGGTALGWDIRGLAMCNWDGSALHPDYKQGMADLGYTGQETSWPDDQPYAFMRFARLMDSVIEPAVMCTLRFREDAEGKPVVQDSFSCGDISRAIRDRWRLVMLGTECAGNRIAASLPGQVDLQGEASTRNFVTILNPAR